LVTRKRVVAGVLALATVVLAAAGEAIALSHTAGPLGLFMLAAAAPLGIIAWLALGAPMSRSDLRA
jgi:hypothetical protein